MPREARRIDSKWVMRVKRDQNGQLVKLKARLTARGFRQRRGIDFEETYAATAAIIYQRILLALSAQLGWVRRQIDAVGAYLMGDLHHQIYMHPPQLLHQFMEEHSHIAVKHGYRKDATIRLGKPLYGLKQAGAEWQAKLRSHLAEMGFKPLIADKAIYVNSDATIIIGTHVDDFLIFARSQGQMDGFIDVINGRIEVTDLGEPEYYLGIRIVARNDGSLSLVQDEYAASVLDRYGATQYKAAATPHAHDFTRLENP
jgi:hypothetical protein